ncbi:MAG: hypothetical protein ABEH65_07890 [Halobacteriales archaeon]
MVSNSEADRTAAIEELLKWANEIATAEIEQAVTQLDANDELTEEQRAVITDLGWRLSHRIVASPVHSLRTAAADDEEAIREALQLFDTGRLQDTPEQ